MDPILSWVVCLLSAFLLAAGGFLLARALSGRRLARRAVDITRLKETLGRALQEREAARNRVEEIEAKLTASEAAIAAHFEAMDRDGFGGPTELPDPHSYFDRQSVPRLQQISEDEYEIPDAAPPSAMETVDADEGGLDPQDQTRQFNIHSPEAVVRYMHQIDELTDENQELRDELEDRDLELKEKRVEGSEHVHRFAALDATAVKLRAELKRRNERIRQLEERLNVQLASNAGSLGPPSRKVPPPPPSAAFTPRGARLEVRGPHDGPTLEVRRMSREELNRTGPKGGK